MPLNISQDLKDKYYSSIEKSYWRELADNVIYFNYAHNNLSHLKEHLI